MIIEELKEQLRIMGTGSDNVFIHPDKMPPEVVDSILDELGYPDTIGEDWNGCDLDWSAIDDIEFEGMKFHICGSGYSSSMVFQKN